MRKGQKVGNLSTKIDHKSPLRRISLEMRGVVGETRGVRGKRKGRGKERSRWGRNG